MCNTITVPLECGVGGFVVDVRGAWCVVMGEGVGGVWPASFSFLVARALNPLCGGANKLVLVVLP